MNQKSQPWVHSWYADSLGFFLVPFLFVFLAAFDLPPFRKVDARLLTNMIFLVLFIDWAHIFAQYHRIFSNPLESPRLKWIYPLSYILLIPVMTAVVYFSSIVWIDTALVYFVIFHFIKQHFGFIKIYSKTDGPKTSFEARVENALVYLSMFTPVVYWHVKGFDYDYKWITIFIKSPLFYYILWPMLTLYTICLGIYIRDEWKRTKKNGMFNIPKNISLLSAMLGWGAVSLLSESTLLIIFTVTLTHDLSYTFYVWFIARRDHRHLKGEVKWFSWWSIPGFFFYVGILVVLSDILMVVHLELTQDKNWDYWIWGQTFNALKVEPGWLLSFGWALFFATQAHHYFIDRYLWKKEKDLFFQIKTGNYP